MPYSAAIGNGHVGKSGPKFASQLIDYCVRELSGEGKRAVKFILRSENDFEMSVALVALIFMISSAFLIG
mgnify:CR=1 FL=1